MTSRLRRGIGGSVLDRSANATRDFSEQSGAFRSEPSFAHCAVGDSHGFSRGLRSERLSTLPGQVAPGHLTALDTLTGFPHSQRRCNDSRLLRTGGRAGTSTNPRLVRSDLHGGSVQKFIDTTLAALIISAPTGRKETNDVAISLQAGRPMPLNRQAEDVLIDLEIWRRKALADNGRIDPEEAMEALPMVEEAQRILNLMAPTWGQINSMLDAATGMFSPKVQRNNREIVSRYPDNIVAFPVARDHAAGD